jgi:prefoldin subunit 5
MSKDPQLIKSSLRPLHGKAQLFPADISTIQQALMDLADNVGEIRKRLENLEATASHGSARHAAGTASPDEAANGA